VSGSSNAEDFGSVLKFLYENLWYVLAIVAIGVPLVILLVRAGRRPNRARLRKLIGRDYSDEKSLIGIWNSISIDDKARRFAVIVSDLTYVCTADEIVAADYKPSSKESLFAKLTVHTTNPALPIFEISVINFREDRLEQIHARLMALQKQGGPAKPATGHETPPVAGDDKITAIEELNRSIVALTEVARKLADELHEHRMHGKKG